MSERVVDVVALRRPLPIVLALVVNFGLSPLMAVALSRLVPLSRDTPLGLLGSAPQPAHLPPGGGDRRWQYRLFGGSDGAPGGRKHHVHATPPAAHLAGIIS